MKMLQLHDKATQIAQTWRANILHWYKKHGRISLPWRNLSGENAPYGVYVSEIMLQQTQVKRVLESYYIPFMKAFPTLTSLANAQEESLLKLWEGLGYYTRVRNMQKSARICCEKFNNALPQTYAELISLPGIGKYTAGAILCFGFRQSMSFVDGNIRRVLCRIFALENPKERLLDELAALLLDSTRSFDYNQALLDVGAMICTPKNPACLLCPVRNICKGQANPALYPTPKKSILEPLTLHLAIYVDKKGKIAFIYEDKKEGKNALYQGLYNLPNIELENITNDEKYYKKCGSFKHHYTKYAITANVYKLDSKNLAILKQSMPHTNLYFFSSQELDSKPLSSLCKKALQLAGFNVSRSNRI
ncbi:A/G-specific adenine glycosylase [Helicobacter sp. MIT 21-1697]|uniref:A/G-specific adenine glycosylase n=1 Tax=Helicobacter sp. MIT 21-1697 TaxID=2993733 RepID=UPI00224B1A1C|nr:A/G-specific adenine glycosylase [Helicobacter sp. MIT 21-1697]MCX2717141.1 A/G-specific adenine glycosylase [Helicobacter sp. MIT 21-1697]